MNNKGVQFISNFVYELEIEEVADCVSALYLLHFNSTQHLHVHFGSGRY